MRKEAIEKYSNLTPLTNEERKKLCEVIESICKIDNEMKFIFQLTGQRQHIVFKDHYRYMFLNGIEQFFKKESTPAKVMIGCVSVRMNYCTVKIIRGPEKLS